LEGAQPEDLGDVPGVPAFAEHVYGDQAADLLPGLPDGGHDLPRGLGGTAAPASFSLSQRVGIDPHRDPRSGLWVNQILGCLTEVGYVLFEQARDGGVVCDNDHDRRYAPPSRLPLVVRALPRAGKLLQRAVCFSRGINSVVNQNVAQPTWNFMRLRLPSGG
jgi:hypothetical protein